jgi:hypothetical protein
MSLYQYNYQILQTMILFYLLLYSTLYNYFKVKLIALFGDIADSFNVPDIFPLTKSDTFFQNLYSKRIGLIYTEPNP